MITEEIVFAIDDMIELCTSEEQAKGMRSLREMLCDFDGDVWASTNEADRREWLSGFLSCPPHPQQ